MKRLALNRSALRLKDYDLRNKSVLLKSLKLSAKRKHVFVRQNSWNGCDLNKPVWIS